MRLITLLAAAAVSTPLVAQATWQPLAQLPQTFNPFYPVSFDTTRGRLHLLDGTHWTFDGTHWLPGPGPSLYGRKLAYDPVRDRTVAVGEGSGFVPQTWGFDGASWAQLSPQAPAENCYGLVWHAQRQTIVWFGDLGLYEWNGVVWQTVATTGTPPAVATNNEFDVVYDPNRNVLAVLRRLLGTRGETWELDGTLAWQHFVPTPPSLSSVRFGFDPMRNRYVAIGPGQSSLSDEVWERAAGSLDAWQLHAQSPNATGSAPMAWDPIGQRLLVATWSPMGPVLGYAGADPALYHQHGNGCGGGTLRPASYQALPYAGAVFHAEIGSTNSPLGLLVTGLDDQMASGASLPMSLSGLGMGNCLLRVSPDLLTVMLPVAPGVLGAGVQLGPTPSALGVLFYQQALVFVAGANPFGALMTNSMRGVKGRP